jgi:hypothetical protein
MKDFRLKQPIEARVKGPARPAPPRLSIRHDLRDTRFDSGGVDQVAFEGATIERVDFSGFRFDVFTSSACRFIDCDFSKTRFEHAGGFSYDPPSTFIGCRFDGADLRAMGSLKMTRFERCSFVGAKIEDWDSDCAEFVGCTFGGKVVRALFSGRPHDCWASVARTTNEFHRNDFRQADLIDCRFSYGVDIDAQLWPDDPKYLRFDRWVDRVAAVRSEIAKWEDTKARAQANAILDIYSESGYQEQSVVILRRDTLRYAPERVRDAVWGLLASVL